MAYEVNGKVLETTENGYLESPDDWDRDVAEAIAAAEGLTLTPEHWDVIDYLRDAYVQSQRRAAEQSRDAEGHAGKMAWPKSGQQDPVRSLSGQSFQAGGQDRGAAGEPAQGRLLTLNHS